MNANNRLVQILILNVAMWFMGMAVADNSLHQKSAICSNQVYVNAVQGADLKEQPHSNARSVMKLAHMQYLCVVHSNQNQQSDAWLQVKKVPLMVKNISCQMEDNTGKCLERIGDFPSKWLIQKPKGKKCQLLTKVLGSEQQLIVFTKGLCATGWIKTTDVQYFAD